MYVKSDIKVGQVWGVCGSDHKIWFTQTINYLGKDRIIAEQSDAGEWALGWGTLLEKIESGDWVLLFNEDGSDARVHLCSGLSEKTACGETSDRFGSDITCPGCLAVIDKKEEPVQVVDQLRKFQESVSNRYSIELRTDGYYIDTESWPMTFKTTEVSELDGTIDPGGLVFVGFGCEGYSRVRTWTDWLWDYQRVPDFAVYMNLKQV